eukprot:TRINITY_DN5353_c0_g1_i2.p1 TRINITY_DN5353_c0_g1~~TRINITY_DN5353_c0_g1_i2.p1  ORF type:complete len:428 (-),score=62.89 TRINITY_DN5353_c0_g1_i2:69-1352(-)
MAEQVKTADLNGMETNAASNSTPAATGVSGMYGNATDDIISKLVQWLDDKVPSQEAQQQIRKIIESNPQGASLLSQPYSEVKEQKTSETKRSKTKKDNEEGETETEDSDDSSEAQEAGRIEDDDDLFIPGKTSGKRSRPTSDNDKKPRKRQKVNSGEAIESPPGSPSSSKGKNSKQQDRQRKPANFWAPEESDKLLEIIKSSDHGPKKWKQIAKALNQATGGQKTPSQCSQHYHRVAAPGINKGTWTKDEDDKLASLFQQYGACWSQVSKYMPKRTDTQCARRWAKVEHMYQKDGTRRLSERSIRIVRKDDSFSEDGSIPMPQEKDRTILDKVEENVIASTLMKIKNEVKPSPNNTNGTEATAVPTASPSAVTVQADSNGSAHAVGAIDLLGNFISSTHMEANQLKPENGVASTDKAAEPTKMEMDL